MKTKEQQKKEIQNDLQSLSKEIDNLTKRRESIRSKRNQAITSIDAQKKSIGQAMLDDRDTTQASNILARDQAAIEGMDEALDQANARIASLNDQLAGKQRSLVMVDFNHLADEAYVDFLGCIDMLSKAEASLVSLEEKFSEMNGIGAQAGMQVDHDDHLRMLYVMCRFLRGENSSNQNISYKLQEIENNYKATLAIARAKKGN